jgi:hypothetical protein
MINFDIYMSNINSNENSLSIQRSDKKFICQYCQKGFTRKNNMVVHQRENPFQSTFLKRYFDGKTNS